MKKLELMKTANEVRKGIITAVHSAKCGHPGGSLSAADIYTYLFFGSKDWLDYGCETIKERQTRLSEEL